MNEKFTLRPIARMLAGFTLSAAPAFAAETPAPEVTLPSVNVRDAREREPTYQPGITNTTKIPLLPRDIPASITTVPEQLILDRNADTMREALRNVPGLTFNAGEGGRIGDNITLRGYSVVGDLYLDGVRDVAQYNREVFNLEQIDILRGSASMLFGRGSTGGVINQVSKQPRLVDGYKAQTTLGSYDYKRVTADLNKVVGDNAAVRLNLMKTDTDSFRDQVHLERWGVAPSLRWGIGTQNEFALSYYKLKDDNLPDYGVPFFAGRPLDVPVSRFYGLANADYERNDTGVATATYIHRFDNDTSIRTVLRKADYERDLWAVAPRLAAGTTAITDATVVNRQRQARGGTEDTLTSQTDFTTKFKTGPVTHLLLAGAELAREDASRWSYASAGANPATTVGNPNPYPVLPANYFTTITRTNPVSYNGRTTGFYAQDMMELTPMWKLLLGARWDRLDADYYPVAGPLSRKDTEWSYRTGVILQPSDTQSYYVAYGTSFNPSAELYSLDQRGANTPPEKNRNMEAGAKWELFEGNLSLRTAVFRTEKTNERNTDLSNPTVFLLSGRRHTDGIEVEAAGRITRNWEIFGGVALMRAKIDEASAQQANTQGNVPINTPNHTANLWSTYRLGGGWRIGGGAEAVGTRYGNATNTNAAPRYVRWDAMVAYEQRHYALKANVLNLFDKAYYEGVYSGHVIPGTARVLQASVEFKY